MPLRSSSCASLSSRYANAGHLICSIDPFPLRGMASSSRLPLICSTDRFAQAGLASSSPNMFVTPCPPKRLNRSFYEASGCAAANFSGVICTGEIIKETLQIQSAEPEPIERSEVPFVSEACVSCLSECCDNGNFEAAAR